ncbi:aminotransferase class I/II-fold pyridoxal phosphate-dependent enzyme [Jhaorihella thermophila]
MSNSSPKAISSSRQGSGYRVCAIGEVERLRPARRRKDTADQGQAGPPLPFEPSQPDMRLFPYRQWARAVSRLCRTDPRSMLEGGSRLGNAELREAIADHVAQWRGIDVAPGQIIVTAGSTDALEICLRTLAEAGDTIALEDPGYPPLRHFAKKTMASWPSISRSTMAARCCRARARPRDWRF